MLFPKKEYCWHKIASHANELPVAENRMGIIDVGGKQITIGVHGDQYFACAYKCPHAGGILSDGFVDVLGNIVCPLHRYKFNPCNGRNVTGEGYWLAHWPVEVREDGVYIGLNV